MKYELLSRLFRAVSNKKRIRIIKALQFKDMTINELSDYTSFPYKTVERHLKILAAVNLVKQKRDGLEINFSINANKDEPFHLTILKLIEASK